MAKKSKKGKNRLDKYYYLAKEQGYRSRAAFKLIQLNRKYNFLSKCECLLDLCAAPGGWLQVAAKNMPSASLILGVDLVAMKTVPGARTLIGDITTQECRADIKRELKGRKMDVVLHDGAPNVGGAWANEAYSQSTLVLDSLKLATEFLAPKGTFVTKIFRSKDYNALLYAFNQLFEKVEATKPAASRNASAEIFVVCLGFKAPSKIDARLLDSRVLFQDITEVKKVMGPEALLRQKIKQRRFREGYEEGISTSHKEASALSFVASDSPVEMLGQFTKLLIDGSGSWVPVEGILDPKDLAARIRDFAGTDKEIRTLCQDLQVLGRSDFKALLKWRLALRKLMKDELGAEGAAAAADKAKAKAGEDGEEEEEDPEEKLLKEMQELKDKVEREGKRDRKRRREMKQKARLRAAQMAQGEGIGEDPQQGGPEQLFGLNALTGKGALGKVGEQQAFDEDEMEALAASSGDEVSSDGSSSDDDDDDNLRYELELEAAMEDSYSQYLERKGVRAAAAKEKRKRLGMDGELGDEEEGEEGGVDVVHLTGDGAEDEESEEEGGGLNLTFDEGRAGVAKTGSAMAAQWFKQSLFDDPNLLDDEDEEDGEEGRPAAKKARAAAEGKAEKKDAVKEVAKGKEVKAAKGTAAPVVLEGDDADDEEEGPKPAKKVRSTVASGGGAGQGDFEVVPQEESHSESEDEFDMLDDNGKAEVLALAKRMLRRSDRESIMDQAYNRYAFHDDNLPVWFEEDEKKHMRPIIPVTKAEVDAEKARLQAIDARPIKKVAEAKARKKIKLGKRLEQARHKANSVADQEDVPTKSKMKEIEKIYAKARSSVKGKGGKGKKGGKSSGAPLDSRLRKDKKSMKRAQQKLKKGGKGGRSKGRK